MTILEMALEKAHAILGSECSPIGLMASPEGYPHVWARDSVITSLGVTQSVSPGHENCLRVSLATLAGQQSELGAIPERQDIQTIGAAGQADQQHPAGVIVQTCVQAVSVDHGFGKCEIMLDFTLEVKRCHPLSRLTLRN